MTMPAGVAKNKDYIQENGSGNVGFRWTGNAQDARKGRCKGCGEPRGACTYACKVLKRINEWQ